MRRHQLKYLSARRELAKFRVAQRRRGTARGLSGFFLRSPRETLDELDRRLESGDPFTYLRFGDGDITLLYGQDDLLQPWQPSITVEMAQAFGLSTARYMKALPGHSNVLGREPDMKPGFHLWDDEAALSLMSDIEPFFPDQFAWSQNPYGYLVRDDPDRVAKSLIYLASLEPIVATSERIVSEIASLFRASAQVKTPSSDVYSRIDWVEDSVSTAIDNAATKSPVLLLGAGCSGRILAKRISIAFENVTIVDPGSILDALGGDVSTRAWMQSGFVPPTNFQRVHGLLAAQGRT